jgi:hypothetical protein
MQNMQVDIDEKDMTEIAAMTGGQYFRAQDTEGSARYMMRSTRWRDT